MNRFYTSVYPTIVTSLVTLIGTLMILIHLNLNLALAIFVSFPLFGIVLIPFSRFSEKVSEKLQLEMSFFSGDLTEYIKEIELIKASNAEQEAIEHLRQRAIQAKNHSLKSNTFEGFMGPFSLLFLFTIIAMIFTYGGQRVASGQITIGTLFSFLLYLFQLLNPISSLMTFFTELSKKKGALKAIDEILRSPSEDLASGKRPIKEGGLIFDDVSFAYNSGHPVLKNVHLEFPLRQKIAIVGPSGSGKTSIVNLIERFYQVSSGNILLGNEDISSYNLKEWRNYVALVSQTNPVISGTIKDNLIFGLDYKPTLEQLHEALTIASLNRDVEELELGLDSFVGESGKLLSGGQKQRLQIARAYLKHSSIIILDEATANLDADTEYAVMKGLKELSKDKIIIVIAHRLSTVVDAAIIYFLEDGIVTGAGSHADLLESHKNYSRYVQEQMI